MDPNQKQRIARELGGIVGARHVVADAQDVLTYETDAGFDKEPPDLVVYPASTAEVSAIMRLASREGVPIIGRGSGTNISGGVIPTRGGIVVHFTRMNRVLEIDVANRRAVAQPGVINGRLNDELAPYGFFYAPDPASYRVSTIGGNVAENAGGPHCLKYGVTTNHVLGVEVVLHDGQVAHLGSYVEDAPGYDLTGLFVGSEGTFGLVTSATLRITPIPERIETMLAIFPSLEASGEAVSDIIASGMVPATLEVMDHTTIEAVERSARVGYPVGAEALIIIELDGQADGLDRLREQVVAICRRHGATEVRVAADAAEREALWRGRRGAYAALAVTAPNNYVQDVTVPRTHLAEMFRVVAALAAKYDLFILQLAHAGDGNLHPLTLFDERVPGAMDRVKAAAAEMMVECVRRGGSITGEHGVGLEKREHMALQFSPFDLELMRRIRAVWDPQDLLNPGKILPPHEPVAKAPGAAVAMRGRRVL